MHSMRGKRGLIAGLALALATTLALPGTAHAGPDRDAKRTDNSRYRLFAGNLGAITINRIYYGLNSRGEVGVDSTNSSTIGGGFWPKGTGNQYMFNSGLQVAGIVQGDASNPWAGDTTGGMFFDAAGTRQHGTAVTEISNATNPVDVANWPQAAYVPQGDDSELIFDELLRGRVSASQGDVWWMSSEADPGLNAARPHPLGVVAEYRVMGWNFPSGNEDLIYLVLTFYNITSLNEADYAQYRPGLRDILIEESKLFHSRNNATFGVTLPSDGYTIDPFYAAFAADPDVTNDAGNNFSSVNMPFAMGYAYEADFTRASGWTFSPNIFGAPFFAGAGFVGVKYLKSATGPGEIALFSNTCNGCGTFNDPATTTVLYKYLSGTVTPADGVSCNQGNVEDSRICWVRNSSPTDVRMLQSSSPVTLEAGASASIVVSYIHAAPVKVGSMVAGTRVLPGDPTALLSVDTLTNIGANRIDSLMGYNGYEDSNLDGIVQQNEMIVVPGSLLGKANTAQSIFDSKFLLPFAPDAPQFFLIPGNGQVTVVWQPSGSETEGDPYFGVAGAASVVPEGGGAPVPNALYDANYRNFDVEGYRIYRGRVDSPTSLSLIAQYDYSGTAFSDFTGQIIDGARGSQCAPEIGVTGSCSGVFDPQVPGEELVSHVDYDITGNLVQVAKGNRTTLATGDVIVLSADTAVVGGNSGLPALQDTGVPFVYVDQSPRNGIRYFYAVTAFDVNSITSTGAGNTSLESARITKDVFPRASSGNYINTATTSSGVFGRNGLLTDNEEPTIDPNTGKFSKAFPPTNAVTLELAAFVKEVLSEPGEVSITVDSIETVAYAAASTHDAIFHYTVSAPAGNTVLSVPMHLASTSGGAETKGAFDALIADPELAAAYGAPSGGSFGIGGSYEIEYGAGYYKGVKSRGCVNGVTGFTSFPNCDANGPRWWEGTDNSAMMDNPNAANIARFRTGTERTEFNNVGGPLTGVRTIFMPMAYNDMTSSYRDVEGVLSPFLSAADYRVYWGEGGAIDSVIDIVHDVEVPFDDQLGPSWGILNQSGTNTGATYHDQRSELTISDIGCLEPIKTLNAGGLACSGAGAAMERTAKPGAIAYSSTSNSANSVRNPPPAAGQGFLLYLKGHTFVVELEGGVPAAGTIWTMRDYVGAISGGMQASGDGGPMSFSYAGNPRPFASVGSSVKFSFDVVNELGEATAEAMENVHTVPDPYYVTSGFEATTTSKTIKFVNLPSVATIRIYTTSGVLVRVLKHETTSFSGEASWDVRNRNNQFVASGVYFYHVEAENGETTIGRMTIINYAQ